MEISKIITELELLRKAKQEELDLYKEGNHKYERMLIHGEIEGLTLAMEILRKAEK